MLNYAVKELEQYYKIKEVPIGDFSTIKGKARELFETVIFNTR